MKIWNTDKNEMVEITYAPTGCDCLRDLSADSSGIKYNEVEARYEADNAEIEWWQNWVAKSEEADALEAEVANKLSDKSAASEISIEAASDCDFESAPAARIHALKQALKV